MLRLSLKALSLFIAVAVLSMGLSGTALAKVELISKVDSFVLFVDHSGSMAMKHDFAGEDKIVMAKNLLTAMNQKIPALGYNAGTATFSPYAELYKGDYGRNEVGSAIAGIAEDYPIYGRMTSMGNGLFDLKPTLDSLPGRLAVIIVSDGGQNQGSDPVAEASALYNAFGARLCIHVISLADSEAGQAVLDSIAGLSGCSVSASGAGLLESEAALDKFVRDVFYEEKVIDEMEEVVDVIPLRINFDFDSAAIRGDMEPVLDEAASLIGQSSGQIMLEGHTCNIGSDEYNQGLSERRAKSVQKYLEGKGVSASRLDAMGLGESQPKYDNSTEEGRRLNRRVEILIQ